MTSSLSELGTEMNLAVKVSEIANLDAQRSASSMEHFGLEDFFPNVRDFEFSGSPAFEGPRIREVPRPDALIGRTIERHCPLALPITQRAIVRPARCIINKILATPMSFVHPPKLRRPKRIVVPLTQSARPARFPRSAVFPLSRRGPR